MSEGPRIAHWTEDALDGLEPYEHDFQEFKSAPYMVDDKGIAAHFLAALAKQISAFSNGAGGRLFLGINDDGTPDGGIRVDLKGGGTRAWLEDVIPGAVDPPLKQFNVYEVLSRARGPSRIKPGHAVFVIDIPPSEDAPHQATDHRYYLRIAGKSRPMGHVHVQDVLRRTRHPLVDVVRVTPFGAPVHDDSDPRGPKTLLCLQAFVANQGRHLAQHVGCEFILPRPLVSSEARGQIPDAGGADLLPLPPHAAVPAAGAAVRAGVGDPARQQHRGHPAGRVQRALAAVRRRRAGERGGGGAVELRGGAPRRAPAAQEGPRAGRRLSGGPGRWPDHSAMSCPSATP